MTRSVEVTRPDKLLWPALEITKRRYVDYLDAVGDRMLPWLRERPLTLVRAPDGVAGERYYQKDTPRYAPSWIRTVAIRPPPSARSRTRSATTPRRSPGWGTRPRSSSIRRPSAATGSSDRIS